jgi:Zn-dependent protease with chaperone function
VRPLSVEKTRILSEIKANGPFNIFNIVALVAILVIGYFLYKKFTEKFQKGAISMPQAPLNVSKEPVSIVAQAAEVPPPPDDATPQ